MPAKRPAVKADPVAEELALLARGELADPHRVLGLHDGVVRAWRPAAESMRVLLSDGGAVDMERVHPDGAFAAKLAAADDEGYRPQACYPDGGTYEYEDP